MRSSRLGDLLVQPGVFGKGSDPAHLEKVLRQLSLWYKRDNKIMTLR